MPQYVITYLGGNQPSGPEEGKQHMAKYMEWISSLGENAVSPMNPFKGTHTVNPDGTAAGHQPGNPPDAGFVGSCGPCLPDL